MKKHMGRGLEEISNIFLSSKDEGSAEKRPNGLSPFPVRRERCTSCTNMVDVPFEPPKCRIFTIENEKYGVAHMDRIKLYSGHYCQYFHPVREGKGNEALETKGNYTCQKQDMAEVEEAVNIQRKIAYPNTENGHRSMRKTLFRHLEEGFSIRRIELLRTDITSTQKSKKCKEESVTIFVKDAPLSIGTQSPK